MAELIIIGASVSHITQLGITLPAVDDYGELFVLAVEIPAIGTNFR